MTLTTETPTDGADEPTFTVLDDDGQLTDTGRAVLDFEGRPWKYPGQKESQIRERFGVTPIRYYRAVRSLLEEECALAYAPVLVHMRRRQVQERHRERSARGAPR